ncbi:MAG: DUF3566 domain-containing protein [Actinomycetota bacterium]|nr:DUF3566 domain-containing protein [Actinomycetota bacterium]
MSSSREDPKGWSAKPDRPAGSRGPSDDLDATNPFIEPLDPPLVEGDPAAPPAPRPYREPLTKDEDEMIFAPPRRRPVKPTRRRRVKPVRRVKRVLRHIDPLSVLKVSLLFYGCFLLIWLVFVAILYWIVEAAGLFELIENVRDAFVLEGEWSVTLGFVEKWAFFIGVIVAVVMSLLNLFLAFLYNVVADVIGGIEVTFVERDL